MKKCKITLMVAALVLAIAAPASAIEVKLRGNYTFIMGWKENSSAGSTFVADVADYGRGYTEGALWTDNDDDFRVAQRVRIGMDIIASETLKGVLEFEIGPQFWGRNTPGGQNAIGGYAATGNNTMYLNGNGGQLNTDGVNIKTRHAYIDWYVPMTDNKLNIKMGLQPIYLPSAVAPMGGNQVLQGDVGGISASYKFNNSWNLTGFWARPYDMTENITSGNTFDAADIFGLIGMYNSKAVTFRPWLIYSNIGNNTNFWTNRGALTNPLGLNANPITVTSVPSSLLPYSTNPAAGNALMESYSSLWSGGIALRLTPFESPSLAPLSFYLDAMYGNLNNHDKNAASFAGWYAAARIDYKASWGIPGIFGWYASGDNANALKDRRYGRLPVFNSQDPVWNMLGMAGGDAALPGVPYGTITTSAVGTWGIGLQIKDYNLGVFDRLFHTIRVGYLRGTNNSDNISYFPRYTGSGLAPQAALASMGEVKYLTTKDYSYEFTLANRFEFDDNLYFYLDLGWQHMKFDQTVWHNRFEKQNVIKAMFGAMYKF